MNQEELTALNRRAWEADAYRAWVNRYGEPPEAAAAIAADPRHAARRVLPFIGDPGGLSIAVPLGSHGRVAVALALSGADVTVFDVSAPNARYAREVAAEAGVGIDYVLGDFLVTAPAHADRFDVVAMELGVVHYFLDIDAFVGAVRMLVGAGGKVVLTEFHPLPKKALRFDSGELSLHGSYFESAPERAGTPYGAFVSGTLPECRVRRWNLGETVSAFAAGGFRIERLIEHPAPELVQLPGTFTLVALAD